MRYVVFDTPELQKRGLQHVRRIPDATLFVFPLVRHGVLFHSNNVPEPFDIAFLDCAGRILWMGTVVPEDGTALAPPGTCMAVEGRAGLMASAGFGIGMPVLA